MSVGEQEAECRCMREHLTADGGRKKTFNLSPSYPGDSPGVELTTTTWRFLFRLGGHRLGQGPDLILSKFRKGVTDEPERDTQATSLMGRGAR